jgi:hypothetical protein
MKMTWEFNVRASMEASMDLSGCAISVDVFMDASNINIHGGIHRFSQLENL